MVGNFSISSPSIELLAKGTGDNVGKVAIWETNATGQLNQDLNTLDNSEDWITILEAIENGYEEKFGNDLNNDGLVSSAKDDQGNKAILLKNGSSTAENVSLKDESGNKITQSGTDTFTVKKSIANQGFSLFNTSSAGYQVLVEGKGTQGQSIWSCRG